MADNKIGPNLQAGAGFLAKRVQKSLNRAQEKVLQKLGKTMETKDEHFELCSQSLNKQQVDGNKLFKDVRAYHTAVKAVHETSKRLSQTLREVYEVEWDGADELAVITESEDLLWNDYEEKLSDQVVRTMDNYTSQFPEVKERVAKRGRKLVDYDSARHHLEALQSAKKKDEGKISKADEEFNKAQNVFEEINNELREELPVLYQSRMGCYVTVFQNISNLRDVFYKEMSVLNHELYNVMKKLENQHSGKDFIVKGLNSPSGKSKKRKSLVISNPIPCNTAFPADHVSINSSTENAKVSVPSSPTQNIQSISEESGLPKESVAPSKDVNSSDSDLSSSGTNTPKRQSECDNESTDRSQSPDAAEEPAEPEAELATNQSDDSGVGVPKSEPASQEVSNPSDSADSDGPQSPEQEPMSDPLPQEPVSDPLPQKPVSDPLPQKPVSDPLPQKPVSDPLPQKPVSDPLPQKPVSDPLPQKPKPPPVPAPRISFRRSNKHSPLTADLQEEKTEEESVSQETVEEAEDSHNPPGFLYKAVALENHAASADGQLQFEEGDVILVLADTQEEGLLKGIREEIWNQHKDLENHSGLFLEKLIRPVLAE